MNVRMDVRDVLDIRRNHIVYHGNLVVRCIDAIMVMVFLVLSGLTVVNGPVWVVQRVAAVMASVPSPVIMLFSAFVGYRSAGLCMDVIIGLLYHRTLVREGRSMIVMVKTTVNPVDGTITSRHAIANRPYILSLAIRRACVLVAVLTMGIIILRVV